MLIVFVSPQVRGILLGQPGWTKAVTIVTESFWESDMNNYAHFGENKHHIRNMLNSNIGIVNKHFNILKALEAYCIYVIKLWLYKSAN